MSVMKTILRHSYTVVCNGKTIGHVPKYVLNPMYFLIKYGGWVEMKVNGKRPYSKDLKQRG